MEHQNIRGTDLQTPRIMFGGNVFGWTLDRAQSFRMLDMLFERGFRFLDLADSYGSEPGRTEQIVGDWMAARRNRDELTIVTKVRHIHNEDFEATLGGPQTHIEASARNSLRRLQTDYIDLYYTHFDDETRQIEEPLEAHARLLQAGKVRYIGASNFSAERLQKALTASEQKQLPRYSILQTHYNLVAREEFESGLRDVCERNQLDVTACFALASGFLTGKYRSPEDIEGTSRAMLVEPYFNQRGLKVIDALDDISAEHGVSNAAVSLAWILAQPQITALLASATRESHLDDFDAALNLQLSRKDLQRLHDASAWTSA